MSERPIAGVLGSTVLFVFEIEKEHGAGHTYAHRTDAYIASLSYQHLIDFCLVREIDINGQEDDQITREGVRVLRAAAIAATKNTTTTTTTTTFC